MVKDYQPTSRPVASTTPTAIPSPAATPSPGSPSPTPSLTPIIHATAGRAAETAPGWSEP
jgi:hypothetical protein